jgi:uncharacterized cupin superfamily protein
MTTAHDHPAPARGEHHRATWMLNSLRVERATGEDTGGQYAVFETWVTPDSNPPPHVHAHEDEAFLVLEGSVDVVVDGVVTSVGPGGFAYGPRGVAHTYMTTSDVARMLVITSPSGSERFFRAVGTPAETMTIPPPQAPDVASVMRIAAEHGITILLPPQ